MNRRAILERFDSKCGICGKQITGDQFDVDHIVPRSAGGRDSDENLRPAHAVCNRSKSANEVASWQLKREPTAHRPLGSSYDVLIGIPDYVLAVRHSGGNPFVLLSNLRDKGAGLRCATDSVLDDLAFHGAYLTDELGQVLRTGESAAYVVWPHVAMRHPRYNQNVDSGLDRAKGEACGFVMRGKATHQRRLEMVARAAELWLYGGPTEYGGGLVEIFWLPSGAPAGRAAQSRRLRKATWATFGNGQRQQPPSSRSTHCDRCAGRRERSIFRAWDRRYRWNSATSVLSP